MFENPQGLIDPKTLQPSSVQWRSPSNIALIKYWGKYGKQLPKNASLSFTLQNAFTETKVAYGPKTGPGKIDLVYRFHGEHGADFEAKVAKYLESLLPYFPFLEQLHLEIDSGNSFPHSAGIASSASAMSALALCLVSMEEKLLGTRLSDVDFDKKCSFMARLGSGSASRSIFEKASIWGSHSALPESSDEYGIGVGHLLHTEFQHFQDDILIVSAAPKPVSSRLGHSLMETNSYAESRFRSANAKLDRLTGILKSGDLDGFVQVVEKEALELHAMMMTSTPSFILMEPNTLAIINKVRAFRKDSNIPISFTLDAGPNVHLLYPNTYLEEVGAFIASELLPLCESDSYLKDNLGDGPLQLEEQA